jgi:DNA-directed RNA polymerase subunit RPC12/RpoP
MVMAWAKRFVCVKCGHSIEAWDEGNPYYFDQNGAKQYAYHPNHERLAVCVGNDSPYLCLTCGQKLMVDSRDPIEQCPDCGSRDMACTYHLEGKKCPFCKQGVFQADPNFHCIS